jgi:hypothetical protein
MSAIGWCATRQIVFIYIGLRNKVTDYEAANIIRITLVGTRPSPRERVRANERY